MVACFARDRFFLTRQFDAVSGGMINTGLAQTQLARIENSSGLFCDVTRITASLREWPYPLSSRLAGMIPPGRKGNDMTRQDNTKLNNEARELKTEELKAVSGGRIKIEVPAAVKAWEIAQIERDNPGF